MKIKKGSYSINIEPTNPGYKATFSNGKKSLFGDSVFDVLTQLRDIEEITQSAFENYTKRG